MLGNYVWMITIGLMAAAAIIVPIAAWRSRRPPK